MHHAVELAAAGIEMFAVGVIVISSIYSSLRFLVHAWQKQDAAYTNYKLMLGRSMLLGLEFLVAADVIRTVALAPTLSNISILGVLVVVRTFLSWSLAVELEGHWPWQSATVKAQIEGVAEYDPQRRVAPSIGGLDTPARRARGISIPAEISKDEDSSPVRKAGAL